MVHLSFEIHGTKGQVPLLVLHGLFGSRQNWRSIGKALSQRLNTQVYLLDQRNHGDSPHAPTMSYLDMSNDLNYFLNHHGLKKIHLMGHSMGGKTAMTFASQYPTRIQQLIVADISPFHQSLSPNFIKYIQYMKQLDALKLTKKSQAEQWMAQFIEDISVRSFLMTNLKHSETLKFRINLDAIEQSLSQLNAIPIPIAFNQRTLFIYGTRSDYLLPNTFSKIKECFPKAEFVGLDGGHWIHAEKPREFIQSVTTFLSTV